MVIGALHNDLQYPQHSHNLVATMEHQRHMPARKPFASWRHRLSSRVTLTVIVLEVLASCCKSSVNALSLDETLRMLHRLGRRDERQLIAQETATVVRDRIDPRTQSDNINTGESDQLVLEVPALPDANDKMMGKLRGSRRDRQLYFGSNGGTLTSSNTQDSAYNASQHTTEPPPVSGGTTTEFGSQPLAFSPNTPQVLGTYPPASTTTTAPRPMTQYNDDSSGSTSSYINPSLPASGDLAPRPFQSNTELPEYGPTGGNNSSSTSVTTTTTTTTETTSPVTSYGSPTTYGVQTMPTQRTSSPGGIHDFSSYPQDEKNAQTLQATTMGTSTSQFPKKDTSWQSEQQTEEPTEDEGTFDEDNLGQSEEENQNEKPDTVPGEDNDWQGDQTQEPTPSKAPQEQAQQQQQQASSGGNSPWQTEKPTPELVPGSTDLDKVNSWQGQEQEQTPQEGEQAPSEGGIPSQTEEGKKQTPEPVGGGTDLDQVNSWPAGEGIQTPPPTGAVLEPSSSLEPPQYNPSPTSPNYNNEAPTLPAYPPMTQDPELYSPPTNAPVFDEPIPEPESTTQQSVPPPGEQPPVEPPSQSVNVQNEESKVFNDEPAEEQIEELEKEEEEEKEKKEILEKKLVREEREVRRIGGFGVFLAILAMIFTAHQMSENPDGIYASCCRLILTLSGCAFKMVFMPFRAAVGGHNRGYGHIRNMEYGYRDPYRPGANAVGGSMELS